MVQGNIVGVSTAIFIGGPGAVFWMGLLRFLGASSAFIESTLGQIFKRVENNEYRGGPAYYIEYGIGGKFGKNLRNYLCYVTIISVGLLLPGVQSNAIASSMHNDSCSTMVNGCYCCSYFGINYFWWCT